VGLATGAFADTAFVINPYAGRIVGWECSTSKHTFRGGRDPAGRGTTLLPWNLREEIVHQLGHATRC
jgi:hypothetical protein